MAAVLVALGYYVAAKLGFAFTFHPRPISILWPPNSLLLAGLLLTPTRSWWVIILAVLPAHLAAELQSGVPMTMVMGWFATNCSEALIGAGLIRLLLREPLRFDSFRHALVFLFAAVGLGPLLSSFFDVSLVKLVSWGEGSYWQLVYSRFLSNALTALVVVPAVLTLASGGFQALLATSAVRRIEATVLFVGLLFVNLLIFEHVSTESIWVPALLYGPLPFLLWAAARLGPRAVSICLLIMVLMATWGAIHGHGPFLADTAQENAWSVQLFLLAVVIPIFLFSAVIAEHKKDKTALRSSEERALKVFRASPDAVALVRLSDGAILDVNDRWETCFGRARAEALGRTTIELCMYANDKDRQTYLRLAALDQARDFEVIMQRKDGSPIHTILSGERAEIGGAECLITVIRDVTREKQTEREGREQRLELMHLSRVAMLGELSGALAHELNQPLTAILSNAQTAQRLIARANPDLDEVREILKDITSEDKRAGEIIRRLRAMFKKGETHFQAISANDLVNEVLVLAQGSLATRHIHVLTRLSGQPVLTRGDRVQLQQVILNLVINACEAMDTPGSIRNLTLQTAPLENGQVQIFVIDGGPGVPAGLMDKLFDPFFTTKSQGLGLGLSISRSIIQSHGGQLLVRNNADRGATFRIVLPALAEGA